MSEKRFITHDEVRAAAEVAAEKVMRAAPHRSVVQVYPIPRGGVPAAYAVATAVAQLPTGLMGIVGTPEEADVFIDDLVDSGATRARYAEEYPGVPFIPLFDKAEGGEFTGQWLVFPWEATEEGSAEDIAVRLLQYIGEDPTREGLRETPRRWLKAMGHWMGGYRQDPAELMKTFTDGAEGCDEMVVVRDIPFYSHCEHHIAPIIGVAHVAYIPDKKIIGLSKLARLVDLFARRLQVQERLTNQVAQTLQEHLQPLGVGVVVEARHLCMESRGIQKQGNYTITSALHGAFKDDPKTRSEFLMLTRGERNKVL